MSSMRSSSGARRDPSWMTMPMIALRALEVLHAQYAENLSLDWLAHTVGADKYRVAKAFKRLTGLPPHAFQTRLRISAARRLLASEMSLVEIALECGFSSQAHLNRHFGRFLGVTPGLFRRILREGRRS